MCLNKSVEQTNLRSAVRAHKKVAERNIVVYKVFRCVGPLKGGKIGLVSPYQGGEPWPKKGLRVRRFSYALGTEDLFFDKLLKVYSGLHAFLTRKDAVCEKVFFLHEAGRYTIKQMIIPKGTPYIEGIRGDVVSLCLRFKK